MRAMQIAAERNMFLQAASDSADPVQQSRGSEEENEQKEPDPLDWEECVNDCSEKQAKCQKADYKCTNDFEKCTRTCG